MKILLSFLFSFAVLLALNFDANAQSKQRVKFARGSSNATVRGTVRGYAYRDYIVSASAGQMMRVSLTSRQASTVFSIFRPDGGELGTATETDSADGELPVSGDYIIRVAMMRSAARRAGSVSNYSVSISIE